MEIFADFGCQDVGTRNSDCFFRQSMLVKGDLTEFKASCLAWKKALGLHQGSMLVGGSW